MSATGWAARVDPAWLTAICAGLVVVGLLAFMVWFCLQLLAQNGRVLGRVDALEARVREVALALGVTETGSATEAAPLGEGLAGGGLPLGTPAPAFELEDTTGGLWTLVSLLATGRRLVVVFSDAGCGPCNALMPELAGWRREHAGVLEFVVIASGDQDANRAKAAEHDLEPLLLEPDRWVSEAYQAAGTPTAVVIDPDGRIASPAVAGGVAIGTLVAQAARPLLAVEQHAPPVDISRVGEPAPRLTLTGLEGGRIALEDLYAERTLAIFWNPGCGFCQQMLDDLRAFETRPPAGAPRLIVISSGDPDQVREQHLASTVLLDPDGQAMGAFDAHGTPMGLLIEDGEIASHIAAGAEEVFALARAPARARARSTENGERARTVSHWLDEAAHGLSEGRYSRRQVLRRGGAAAGGALLGPLVREG